MIKAYADFHKMVEQEQGAVRNATLASVVQSGKTMRIMQADMRKNLAITEHTDGNAKDLMDSTGRIYERLEGKIVSGDASFWLASKRISSKGCCFRTRRNPGRVITAQFS